ncbi:unnamed protein product [Symbiodinium necroappetens]|uniref:Uncharacterized protein n=1 Tax=Symbiodinium necroappetens TaxID=1628268 RepID=A0A812U4V1_9DINO|nr:unnamed protein product [Symbiodinium necroappetens]
MACTKFGLAPELLRKMIEAGFDTFGRVAFAAGANPMTLTDSAVDEWIATFEDPLPSLFQISVIRRIAYESQNVSIADLKARVEPSTEVQVRKLPVAERLVRQEEQAKRLTGLQLTPHNMPGHACVDEVVSMIENNTLKYLPMNRWISRSQELALRKNDPAVSLDNEGNIKISGKTPDLTCDTSGLYALRQAFQRCALAFDLGHLATFGCMEAWTNDIFERTQRTPPKGYAAVSIGQLISADREMFVQAVDPPPAPPEDAAPRDPKGGGKLKKARRQMQSESYQGRVCQGIPPVLEGVCNKHFAVWFLPKAWQGRRLVLVAYSVQALDRLSADDSRGQLSRALWKAGFLVLSLDASIANAAAPTAKLNVGTDQGDRLASQPKPLRSSKFPLGLPNLDEAASAKVRMVTAGHCKDWKQSSSTTAVMEVLDEYMTASPAELALKRRLALLKVKLLVRSLERLLEEFKYDDLEATKFMMEGCPLVGTSDLPKPFDAKIVPATLIEQELRATAKARRQTLVQTGRPGDAEHVEHLVRSTLDEVDRGFLDGPFTESEVSKRLGHADWTAVRRFVLVQGAEMKLRPIDDCAEAQLNDAYTSMIKLRMMDSDYISSLALKIAHLEAERMTQFFIGNALVFGATSAVFAFNRFLVLGMSLDLSQIQSQVVVLANKPGRAERISQKLGEIATAGRINRHEAQVLRGLLQFASGFYAGRGLKQTCCWLGEVVKGVPFSPEQVRERCKQARCIIASSSPRFLRVSPSEPLLHLYTDGSWEKNVAGIGAVLFDAGTNRGRVFQGFVDPWLVKTWLSSVGEQLICEIELYALVAIRHVLGSTFEG